MGGLQTLVGILGLTARQPRTLAGACAALESAAAADAGCAAEVVRLGAVPRLVALSEDSNAAVAGAAEVVLQLVAAGADAQAQQKAAQKLKAGGGVAQLVPRLKRTGGEEVAGSSPSPSPSPTLTLTLTLAPSLPL